LFVSGFDEHDCRRNFAPHARTHLTERVFCTVADDDTTTRNTNRNPVDRDDDEETEGASGSRDSLPIPVMSDPPGLAAIPKTDVHIESSQY
jgi:hypothetical protein